MTVRELIALLERVEDKDIEVVRGDDYTSEPDFLVTTFLHTKDYRGEGYLEGTYLIVE